MARSITSKTHELVPCLLEGVDEVTLGQIFIRLIPRFFEEEQEIFRAQDNGEEMYFVTKGSVLLECMSTGFRAEMRAAKSTLFREDDMQEPDTPGHELVAAGGYFGELCLFSDVCNYRHQTAIAKCPPGAVRNREREAGGKGR